MDAVPGARRARPAAGGLGRPPVDASRLEIHVTATRRARVGFVIRLYCRGVILGHGFHLQLARRARRVARTHRSVRQPGVDCRAPAATTGSPGAQGTVPATARAQRPRYTPSWGRGVVSTRLPEPQSRPPLAGARWSAHTMLAMNRARHAPAADAAGRLARPTAPPRGAGQLAARPPPKAKTRARPETATRHGSADLPTAPHVTHRGCPAQRASRNSHRDRRHRHSHAARWHAMPQVSYGRWPSRSDESRDGVRHPQQTPDADPRPHRGYLGIPRDNRRPPHETPA